MKTLLLSLVVGLFATNGFASSTVCSGFESYRGSCAVKKRYLHIQERAAQVSQELGVDIDPLRFRDVIARRFINRPDWEKFLAKQHDDYDPALVYDPKPGTWNNWLGVTDHKLAHAINTDEPLGLETLESWNKGALLNLGGAFLGIKPGQLKDSPNFGANLNQSIALASADVQSLKATKFKTKTAKLDWTDLVCIEDLTQPFILEQAPAECREIYEKAKLYSPSESFWQKTLEDFENIDFKNGKHYWFWFACWPRVAPNSTQKSCGMVHYLSPGLVKTELAQILETVNTYLARPKKKEDPISFAMNVQRWVVGLHPFTKGNGRVSRWLMDYVTGKMGLPPILHADMDKDLTVPMAQLEIRGRLGTWESMDRMEACLSRYESGEELSELQKSPCGLVAPATN